MASYFTALVIAIFNVAHFVCRNGTCQVRHPLMIFYVLVICWIVAEFLNVLFMLSFTEPDHPFLEFSHSLFKSMVGIEQIWMMIELSIRLKQGRDLEKKIKIGRVTAAVFNICLLSAFIIVNSLILVGTIDNERSFRALAKFLSWLYGVLFIGLSISVGILIKAMMDRNKELTLKN